MLLFNTEHEYTDKVRLYYGIIKGPDSSKAYIDINFKVESNAVLAEMRAASNILAINSQLETFEINLNSTE